jgi:hypothetical protein
MTNGHIDKLTSPDMLVPTGGALGSIRRFFALLGVYNYYGYAYDIISRQMKQRDKGCQLLWKDVGVPTDLLEMVIETIQKEMDWPNKYYIPDDPMSLLLLIRYDHLDMNAVYLELEEKMGIPFEDLDQACGMTLGQFVHFCAGRRKSRAGGI